MGRPWYFRLPIFSGLILHFLDFLAKTTRFFFHNWMPTSTFLSFTKNEHTLQYEVITSWFNLILSVISNESLSCLWLACITDIPSMELVYIYLHLLTHQNQPTSMGIPMGSCLTATPTPTPSRTVPRFPAPSTAGRSTGPTLARRGSDVLLTSSGFASLPPMLGSP